MINKRENVGKVNLSDLLLDLENLWILYILAMLIIASLLFYLSWQLTLVSSPLSSHIS